jgi:hypothetical protein
VLLVICTCDSKEGFDLSLQTTPHCVISAFPLEIIIPPLLAPSLVIVVIFTVSSTGISVLAQEFKPAARISKPDPIERMDFFMEYNSGSVIGQRLDYQI